MTSAFDLRKKSMAENHFSQPMLSPFGRPHYCRVFRVDAGCQKKSRDLQDLRPQFFRLLVHRNRVHVDDAVDALVIVLDCDPVFQCAQIISDVKIAGWLDAGEDSCFHAK